MKFILPFFLITSSHLAIASVTSFNCSSTEYSADQTIIEKQNVVGQPSQSKPGAYEAIIANQDGSVIFDGLATDVDYSIPTIFYAITDTSENPAGGILLEVPGNFPYTYDYEESKGGLFEVTCEMAYTH